MALFLIQKGAGERLTNRPVLGSDQQIDVSDLVAITDKGLSNRQAPGHMPSSLLGSRGTQAAASRPWAVRESIAACAYRAGSGRAALAGMLRRSNA
jgi:hypothetical protein